MKRSRAGRVGALVALIALLGAGWWFRDEIASRFGFGAEPVEVSEEAAARAEAKIAALEPGGGPVHLTSVEASSLLRFRAPAWVRDRFHDPAVEFAGDTLRVSGTVATSDLPSHPELDQVRFILPDSSRVVLRGRVGALGEGRAALQVDAVEFAGIPIPQRYYPAVLERFGRREEPGLAPSALAIPLPAPVREARVEDSRLVLSP